MRVVDVGRVKAGQEGYLFQILVGMAEPSALRMLFPCLHNIIFSVSWKSSFSRTGNLKTIPGGIQTEGGEWHGTKETASVWPFQWATRSSNTAEIRSYGCSNKFSTTKCNGSAINIADSQEDQKWGWAGSYHKL
jgi:hypothetical protein